MANLNQIIGSLDTFLKCSSFQDYGANGLQVPGPQEVGHVVTGVSAHLALFDRAAELGADLVVVHHGLFWDKAPRALDEPMKRRLERLFEHEMAVAAYHLPLDAHPEVGNNALLARGLGAELERPFAEDIGHVARFAEPPARDELLARIARLVGREPLCFAAGPDPVQTIGIVSGGGSGYLGEAIALGLDAFLTGEPTERVMAEALEAPITYVAAGHHATETFGVRALGEWLASTFGIRHTFVDVPNPI